LSLYNPRTPSLVCNCSCVIGKKKEAVSRLNVSAAVPRKTSGWRQARLVWAGRQRLLVAGVVVEDAACNDGHVFREVERSGDDKEGEQQEEDRVWGRGRVTSAGQPGGRLERMYALKMNFSVDVNMYSEKVTSYW
jgi:hypothetical protein